MAEPTPGDWYQDVLNILSGGQIIARAVMTLGPEDLANANIMAASKDLLGIAESYADWVEGPDREYILSVIAKAKGE